MIPERVKRSAFFLLLVTISCAFNAPGSYGRMNSYYDSATPTISIDSQRQQVAVTSTGNSNWPTQWRATLELTPGPHQLTAMARQNSGFYSYSTSEWFTNTAGNVTRSSGYDGAAQVTQRTWRNPNGTTNKTQSLTWDARGRLLKIAERDASNNGFNWSAIYDAFGRRWRTVEVPVTNNVAISAQSRTLISYFDPEVEFLELGASVNGATTAWKLYGPDDSGEYGALNGRGGLDAYVPGPELFCPIFSDARGEVLAVYDQDHGNPLWSPGRVGAYGGIPGYSPRPFGQGANIIEASAYDGIWMDSTHYYWRGARYYDPESRQWLSFDPFGFAAGSNPFGYPNDPANYCDPD